MRRRIPGRVLGGPAGERHEVLAKPAAGKPIEQTADRENPAVISDESGLVDGAVISPDELKDERGEEAETILIGDPLDAKARFCQCLGKTMSAVAADVADFAVHAGKEA